MLNPFEIYISLAFRYMLDRLRITISSSIVSLPDGLVSLPRSASYLS